MARLPTERVIGVFGTLETLHSDQGLEFENQIIDQVQIVLGYHETKLTSYRP